MTDTLHTPGKLVRGPRGIALAIGRHTIADCDIRMDSHHDYTAEHEANAARLADCWNQHDELVAAAAKFLAFYKDLAASNPGFMGKLCLQDYAQWNEALVELPAALANATKEGEQDD